MTIKSDLREIPIPIFAENSTALDYHHIPIDLDCSESKEPLVLVSDYGIACMSYYALTDGLNAPYYKSFASATKEIWLRKTVVEKLVAANNILQPYQVELCVLDGYRAIILQKELWQHFMDMAKLALKNPSNVECEKFAGLYCSNPSSYKDDDFTTWPTHNTGGAVDLCLRSTFTKQCLFFGSIFDDAAEISKTSYFESGEFESFKSSSSVIEAKRNRRLLYWSMSEQGFVNYPQEWWHYDYATQMSVMNSQNQIIKNSEMSKKSPQVDNTFSSESMLKNICSKQSPKAIYGRAKLFE